MRIQLDFMAVLAEWPLLLTGVAWTLALTFAALVVGTALGVGCAWCIERHEFALREYEFVDDPALEPLL